MKKYCGKLLISLFILIPCLLISLDLNKVEATANPFTVENIIQSNISDDAKGDISKTNTNLLKNTVVFHKVNDTATYIITIKNNDEHDYIINAIKDNNNNSYVSYEYDNYEDVIVHANSTIDLKVKAKYEKPVNDTSKREQNIESMLSISYEEASKITSLSRMEYFNQVLIIILVVISAVLALIVYYLIKNNKINKITNIKEKIIFTSLLLAVIFVPYMVKALGIPFTISLSGTYYLNDQLVVDIENNDKKIVTYNNSINDLPKEEKYGYTFIGWKSEDGILIDDSTPILKDVKLTPYYVINYYSINYELDGGKVEKFLTFKYTVNDRVILSNPTKEGYTFIGWTGSNINNPSLNVTIPYGSIGNKTYIANYIPNEYSIVYDLNGGQELDNPNTYTIEEEVELDSPIKTGYTFNYWLDENNNEINSIKKGTYGDKELQAIYTPNKYVINYINNDEEIEGEMSKQVVTYDEEIALLTNNYSKDGYRFIGWNTKEDGTGINYNNEELVKNLIPEGEISLYPTWDRLLIATFVDGKEINAKMKKLAGNTNATYNSVDNSIKYFKRSNELNDNYIIVSTSDSDYPIYMWYEKNTIYYYSESEMVYLGSDSSYFFNKLQGLKEIDITTFNTYKVTNFSYMFASLRNLVSLNVSNLKTKNATNMEGMFNLCTNLTELDLSNFNTKKVNNMKNMFKDSSKLVSLNISNFNTREVKTMNSMFWSLKNLKSIDVSSFDTSNVEDMYAMFYSLNSIKELNVSNFNTSNVKDMSSMFGNLYELTTLDLSNFNTSNVKKMDNMFNGSSKLEILNVSSFDTSNVTSMVRMFSSTKSIKELDINNFDTSKVVDMTKMFDNMNSLTRIYVSDKFVVKSKTNGTRMFANDTNLVGGNGTIYDESKMGKEYAYIDEKERPGYFTRREESYSEETEVREEETD